MHFYGFSIDSYVSATHHLTLMEDLAYRRILDRYYKTEEPLVGDAVAIARLIGMRDHAAEVAIVLGEFFVQTSRGWENQRAEREITDYRKKVEAASRAGKASGERRSNGRSTDVEQALNGRSTDVQPITPTPTPTPTPSTRVPLSSGPEGTCTSVPLVRTQQDDASNGSGPESSGTKAILFAALRGSSYRRNSRNRMLELTQAVDRLHAAGIEPDDLHWLALLSQQRGTNPKGLFAHWIDHIDELLKELSKR